MKNILKNGFKSIQFTIGLFAFFLIFHFSLMYLFFQKQIENKTALNLMNLSRNMHHNFIENYVYILENYFKLKEVVVIIFLFFILFQIFYKRIVVWNPNTFKKSIKYYTISYFVILLLAGIYNFYIDFKWINKDNLSIFDYYNHKNTLYYIFSDIFFYSFGFTFILSIVAPSIALFFFTKKLKR